MTMIGPDVRIGPDVAVFFFLAVGALSLFGFLAVASWANARSGERTSYYKSDMLKKLADSSGEGAKQTLEYLREETRFAALRARERQKIAGLVNIAVGVGLMILLKGVEHNAPVYLVGTIPLLIGIALLVYVFTMAPSE
jgi:hypothetical protein